MPVEMVFRGAAQPDDLDLWRHIAEAVLQGRSARILVRDSPTGWEVSIRAPQFETTLAHPHDDGDFEHELRQALRAAGVRVAQP